MHTIIIFSIHIVKIVYLSFELECEKNENQQKEAEIKKKLFSFGRKKSDKRYF